MTQITETADRAAAVTTLRQLATTPLLAGVIQRQLLGEITPYLVAADTVAVVVATPRLAVVAAASRLLAEAAVVVAITVVAVAAVAAAAVVTVDAVRFFPDS